MSSSTKPGNNKFWKKSAFRPPGSVVAVRKSQPQSFPVSQHPKKEPINLSTQPISSEAYTGTVISSNTYKVTPGSAQPPLPPPLPPAEVVSAEEDSFVVIPAEEADGAKKPEPKLSKTDKIRQLISEPVLDANALRKLAWNGIPAEVRPEVWKLLMGYLPANKEERPETLRRKRFEYHQSIPQFMEPEKNETERMTIHQISIDLPRTAPTDPVLAHPKVRRMMERMLYIWAMLHPASGYVQGFNDIITPIILVLLSEYFPATKDNEVNSESKKEKESQLKENENQLKENERQMKGNERQTKGDFSDSNSEKISPIDRLSEEQLESLEADTYWCFSKLLDSIQDSYTPKQPGIIRQLDELQQLVKLISGELDKHFEEEHLMYIEFAFRWVNCLMLRDLPFGLVIRLWDTYVAEPNGEGFSAFHVYFCAAFLLYNAKGLMERSMPDLIIYLQHLPTDSWTEKDLEGIISQAYVYRNTYENSIHLKQFK